MPGEAPPGMRRRSQLDRLLGSMLEAWYNQDTGDRCRFCRETRINPTVDHDITKVCSIECAQNLETVLEARIVIGQRDLDQRGFD